SITPRRISSTRVHSLVHSGLPPPHHYDDNGDMLDLRHVDGSATEEIEQRDEGHDCESDRRMIAEEGSEADALLFGDERLDLRGALLDRVALARRDDVLFTLPRRQS